MRSTLHSALPLSLLLAVIASASSARADDGDPPASPAPEATPPVPATSPPPAVSNQRRYGPAFEVNVLWPIFPGGISELKVLVPVVRRESETLRGELVLGVYADFANRIVRDSTYGKVSLLEGMFGYRQFFVSGLHAEAVVATGWREEVNNPRDGTTLESFHLRVWVAAGWQFDLTKSIYGNVRGVIGPGFRLGDKYASSERLLTGGADANLGFRFR